MPPARLIDLPRYLAFLWRTRYLGIGGGRSESARRHGISDEDIIHAYRNAFQADALDEGVTLLIGTDLAGRFVEVAYVVADDETVVIIHAMPARKHKIR